MINKIKLKNFQSHSDSELEFVNGVNIIFGLSDSGKTAILRSFEWVRKNRPQGFNFLKKGEKCSTVLIQKGTTIIRRYRDKNQNWYKIIQKRSYNKFEAMRGNVPDEVDKILNLSDINIQRQLEPHFLVLKSSGVIAKTINEVINLDKANDVITNINSKIRSFNTDIDNCEKRVFELKDKLKEYEYLDEYKKILDEYKINQVVVNKLGKEVSDLEKLIKKYYDLEDIKQDIPVITDEEVKAIELIKEYKDLKELIDRSNNIQNEIDKNITFNTEEENLIDLLYDIVELREYIDKLIIINNKKKEFEKLNKSLDVELYNLLKSVNVCPICERKFDSVEIRNKIIKNIRK